MNRRNVLFALAITATGSGTAFLTGAFSSLSADRTVTINTASDADAVIALRVDDSYTGLDGGDGDVIELNFSQLNRNATTTFTNALTIENNGNRAVDVSTTIDQTDLDTVLTISPETATLEPDGDSGDEVDFTLTVDLRGYDIPDTPAEITFRAE